MYTFLQNFTHDVKHKTQYNNIIHYNFKLVHDFLENDTT